MTGLLAEIAHVHVEVTRTLGLVSSFLVTIATDLDSFARDLPSTVSLRDVRELYLDTMSRHHGSWTHDLAMIIG